MSLNDRPPSSLKRLSVQYYRHHAWVHWTMTIDKRSRGWLDDQMHATLRELLLHTCARLPRLLLNA